MDRKSLFDSILDKLVEEKRMSLGLSLEDISDYLYILEDNFDYINSDKQNVIKETLYQLVEYIKKEE